MKLIKAHAEGKTYKQAAIATGYSPEVSEALRTVAGFRLRRQ